MSAVKLLYVETNKMFWLLIFIPRWFVSSGEKFQSGGWWPGQGRRCPGRGRSVTGHHQQSHE